MKRLAVRLARSICCLFFTTARGCLGWIRGEKIEAAERRLADAERRVLEVLTEGSR